ncbi:MAG: hypothetical protein AAGI63_18130 [Planctomycetota bacterium]
MAELPPDQDPLNFDDPLGFNPYAPTTETALHPVSPDDVEEYRRTYLTHEASCKSIGTLYLLGAILFTPIGFFALLGAASIGSDERGIMFVVGSLYLCLGLLQGWIGLGLRRLLNRGRTGGIILSTIGLLGFPVVTMISAYFLYLLLSEKGRVVFSPQYRDVIAKTPHIRYRTSVITWIVLLLIVVAVIALLVSVA